MIEQILSWFYRRTSFRVVRCVQILTALPVLGSMLIFAPYLKEFFSHEGYLTAAQAMSIKSVSGGGNGTSLLFWCDDLWFVWVLFSVTLSAAVALLFGIQTQLAAAISWLGYMSFYNRFPSIGYGGSEILFMVLFWLIWLPTKKNSATAISGWPLRMIQINFAIIYLYAAITKLKGASWADGTEFLGVISSQYGIFNTYYLAEFPLLIAAFTIGSTITELSAVFLVWFQNTRRLALFLAFILNVGIYVSINVTFFPFAMFASGAAFLIDEDFTSLHRLCLWLIERKWTVLKASLASCVALYGMFMFLPALVYQTEGLLFEHGCPTGYLYVPGSTLRATKPFCAMQFEAKFAAGTPQSLPYQQPWTAISQRDAVAACQSLGDGYHLLKDSEWMTIADHIAQTAINNKGSDASVFFAAGNENGVGKALGAKYEDIPMTWGCDLSKRFFDFANRPSFLFCEARGFSNSLTCKGTCGVPEGSLRTAVLPTGSVIWDFAGNVWEWTDHAPIFEPTTKAPSGVGQDADGLTGDMPRFQTNPQNAQYFEFSEVTDWRSLADLAPLNKSWSSNQGIGKIYVDPGDSWGATQEQDKSLKAVLRGGAWGNPKEAGIYAINLSHAPSSTTSYIGFRCAYSLKDTK